MKGLLPGWFGLPRLDWTLLLALMLLAAFGLLVLYSASAEDLGAVYRQAARVGGGVVLMLGLSLVPPHVLRSWTPWLYGLGLVLLVLTLLAGEGRGADRWLDLYLVRFQPSEIM